MTDICWVLKELLLELPGQTRALSILSLMGISGSPRLSSYQEQQTSALRTFTTKNVPTGDSENSSKFVRTYVNEFECLKAEWTIESDYIGNRSLSFDEQRLCHFQVYKVSVGNFRECNRPNVHADI